MQLQPIKILAVAAICCLLFFLAIGYIGEKGEEAEERYALCLQMQDSVRTAEYTYAYNGRTALKLIESGNGVRFVICRCDYEAIDAAFDTITPVGNTYIDVRNTKTGKAHKIHYVR